MKSVVRFIVRSIIALFLLPIVAGVFCVHGIIIVFEWFARLAQKVENLLMKLADKYCDFWGSLFRSKK